MHFTNSRNKEALRRQIGVLFIQLLVQCLKIAGNSTARDRECFLEFVFAHLYSTEIGTDRPKGFLMSCQSEKEGTTLPKFGHDIESFLFGN